ncbi:hypothetical protein BDV95DRAFT_334924 [Massariosphaeria phaeospora]|uniref:Uncharacterized protein n=1 Tax=Massariosphaeria phaeospora TaxID=100035 RepID=A0A7C8IDQ7_9PLEO|nr:hypothetical protein BDV95DRAFT_294255 [Massariosphaeria phaeospora]KAF2874531.1 hypothetical protein BDV95DRAFT_334924 [Massariosphaeria phaeospora]
MNTGIRPMYFPLKPNRTIGKFSTYIFSTSYFSSSLSPTHIHSLSHTLTTSPQICQSPATKIHTMFSWGDDQRGMCAASQSSTPKTSKIPVGHSLPRRPSQDGHSATPFVEPKDWWAPPYPTMSTCASSSAYKASGPSSPSFPHRSGVVAPATSPVAEMTMQAQMKRCLDTGLVPGQISTQSSSVTLAMRPAAEKTTQSSTRKFADNKGLMPGHFEPPYTGPTRLPPLASTSLAHPPRVNDSKRPVPPITEAEIAARLEKLFLQGPSTRADAEKSEGKRKLDAATAAAMPAAVSYYAKAEKLRNEFQERYHQRLTVAMAKQDAAVKAKEQGMGKGKETEKVKETEKMKVEEKVKVNETDKEMDAEKEKQKQKDGEKGTPSACVAANGNGSGSGSGSGNSNGNGSNDKPNDNKKAKAVAAAAASAKPTTPISTTMVDIPLGPDFDDDSDWTSVSAAECDDAEWQMVGLPDFSRTTAHAARNTIRFRNLPLEQKLQEGMPALVEQSRAKLAARAKKAEEMEKKEKERLEMELAKMAKTAKMAVREEEEKEKEKEKSQDPLQSRPGQMMAPPLMVIRSTGLPSAAHASGLSERKVVRPGR